MKALLVVVKTDNIKHSREKTSRGFWKAENLVFNDKDVTTMYLAMHIQFIKRIFGPKNKFISKCE